LNFEDRDGRAMLVAGMALASLAGADTAAREHFAGFRSHSLLLAAIPAILVAGALFFLEAPWPVLVCAAVAAFAAAFAALRKAFRRRSGGLSFKIR
jgi:cobalamin synthase